MKKEFKILSGSQNFFKMTADIIAGEIQSVLSHNERCSLVLAGGNTPRGVYNILGTDYWHRISWQRVNFFWGDERNVPPDHVDSNFLMAKTSLLDQVDIPTQNIFRMKGELPAKDAAAEYADTINRYFREGPVQFDIVLLGMGDDGHTASLFPETTALTETDKSTAAVFVDKLKAWRITLTLPVFNAAKNTFFLIAGNSKSEKIRELDRLATPSAAFPASLIQPGSGCVTYLLDTEAAKGLVEKDN